MIRAIQAVPRSRLSSEMKHRWGEKQLKNVKIVYPRAESGGGGTHWLLRPHGGIICVYSLGRGKGRLGVILARRHSHLSQYKTRSSFQLLNTFRPPRSPPSPLAITGTWIQPGSWETARIRRRRALGEATSSTAKGQSWYMPLLGAWEGIWKAVPKH